MARSLERHSKLISWFFAGLFYTELFIIPCTARAEALPYYVPGRGASKLWPAPGSDGRQVPDIKERRQGDFTGSGPASVNQQFTSGPTQPEMQAFSSVNSSNMVDLFSGDFAYNIPLMDVGGYPVNISYRSGISMDQEASWVGLGWNINPGTVARNLRGLPDDFNGKDSIKKITSIRENKTVGVSVGGDVEIVGTPFSVGGSIGVFHNNYRGWGIENSMNASINSAIGSKGSMTTGLSLNNNSQEGLSITPSLSVALTQRDAEEKSGYSGSFSTSLPYNSRTGLKGLQLSAGVRQFKTDEQNQKRSYSVGGSISSVISFASPSYTPSITIPFTSRQFSFTGKLGFSHQKVVNPNVFISGYVSKQRIEGADTLLALPAYGYLHYTEGARNKSALLDFNREKELTFREKPATPHIAIPVYTYDAFSITGEGTGGSFRAYRSDIGFVYDHFIRTKDESDRFSGDIGLGDLVHGGIDLNVNRAYTQNGPWITENALKNTIAFKDSGALFEPVYFRNPGEKSINSKQFYEALGGDDVVSVDLYQPGIGSSFIQATNYLTRYRNKRAAGKLLLTPQNAIKTERDKRTQVISYLTAKQAGVAGLSKYIENHNMNVFSFENCAATELPEPPGTGLPAEYYKNTTLSGTPATRIDPVINFNLKRNSPYPEAGIPADQFSVRWKGRLLAPVTGAYQIIADSTDDGVRLWLNDSLFIDQWCDDCHPTGYTANVNLLAGEYYDIKVEFKDNKRDASLQLKWIHPNQPVKTLISQGYLYGPPVDTIRGNSLTREKRINSFRKEHHISEVDVLNSDGRRYVYGIPVYNFKQREATFAVDGKTRGNRNSGLVGYTHGQDNTSNNRNGKDWYYNSEEMPAYTHSFLLTGILSTDYVDATGNGISDDDPGDAIKFNYSKIRGVKNPYRWRAPYNDSTTYNEGLRTDHRDDKGNYVYGEKELWYLHSIESRTMVATFTLEDRLDLPAIDEAGTKYQDGSAKRLKQINLYTKADLKKNGSKAKPVKTVHFEYSYELCKGVNKPLTDSGKLTLKKIWFSYNGNKKGAQNPYVFNYNAKNPDHNIKSYDRWGNYKDALENPGSSVGNLISNAEHPYALQDSIKAARNAAAWALDSIRLPSGGAIKVTYESDDYAFVQNKRAMQVFKILGLSSGTNYGSASNKLYTPGGDNLYVFVSVPHAVADNEDVYHKYLSGINKLFFRLSVRMPADQYGNGYEYVTCYADLDAGNAYGRVSSNVIWIKLAGISLKGDGGGSYSPLAKAAIQFLRLNLPSKAYPGSEVGDNIDVEEAVKMLASLKNNITNAIKSFDETGRNNSWARDIDTSRSYVRLNTPVYRKYGGGHRVKQVVVYDNWDKMVAGKPAKYGQQYSYTTVKEINGVATTISSGVASYEPGIGGEENPFHEPIEYVEKISALGPVTLAYSEEPLGESFFPSAGVGYSKVRVRTINYQNIKSANGYDETCFYTAYDFPTYTDRSLIDDNTKKRYKPGLANFLRINARHYITLSQGFKVELNDMHGKLRSQASYAETDPTNPTTYTENIYRVENPAAEHKRLANTVSVIRPDGTIDTAALIGKDLELMIDMREQLSITNGFNVNLNSDMFSVPFVPPFFILPSFLNLAQREENQYRSVAAVKVIQRYGILDSVIHIDKGSKISTKDILYDSETGSTVLTRTQNEFNDPIYNFSYPSHWAYEGMGLAYRNIGARFDGVTIRNGRITDGLPAADSVLFASGDELIVAGKLPTGGGGCNPDVSTFPSYSKIWAIDSSVLSGGPQTFFFIDKEGNPYNAFNVSLLLVRSGRRNIEAAIGSVTSLASPLFKTEGNEYLIKFTDSTKVLKAMAAEMKQFWHVGDQKRRKMNISCPVSLPQDCQSDTSCTCKCLKQLFSYLIASKRLFIQPGENITVSTLVQQANAAGYSMSINDCEVLQMNSNKPFYAMTTDSVSNFYRARIGDCTVGWRADKTVNFYTLTATNCDSTSQVVFTNLKSGSDTVTQTFYATESMIHYYASGYDGVDNIPSPADFVDTSSSKIITAYYSMLLQSPDRVLVDSVLRVYSFVRFGGISSIPSNAQIQHATLSLSAHPGGFSPPQYTNAHSGQLNGFGNLFRIGVPSFNWNYTTATSTLRDGFEQPFHTYTVSSSGVQDLVIDAEPFIDEWRSSGNRGLRFAPNYGVYHKLAFSTFGSQRATEGLRPALDVTYISQATDTTLAYLAVEFCRACDTIIDNTCRSIVTDTAFNPYTIGALGNWRADKSYVYYGQRTESDPQSATNVRTAGTFKDFAAFWTFGSQLLEPSIDTMRWVWNSQMTMFNQKGFEIENKDPLGRYNAGLYGYKLTLPVAVIQNARYRESAFEGFEDYDFSTQVCDTGCATDRHFDFSAFKSRLDTAYKHTGKRSLKLNAGEQAAITVKLAPSGEAETPSLAFTTQSNSCGTGLLKDIKSSNAILLPAFSPLKGKKMVISAWVKEAQDCSCNNYINNRIVVAFSGGSGVFLNPSGNIIEGWQRYEGVFDIPAGDTTITISLEATGSTAVYFDDVRVHPFNANMKSFVYSPVNLRLMAELDENNYASFYEYDDDGTLIRVKKETERGIKTIRETRSALLKQ